MDLALPPDVHQFIADLIRDGRCANEAEAISVALKRWHADERHEGWTDADLRDALAAGIAQAAAADFPDYSAADTAREGRAELARTRRRGLG